MFTGIVEERGAVRAAGEHRLEVACDLVLEDSDIGASIAVNGVCLTVVDRSDGTLAFDLSDETLARSSLGRLAAGHPVNLERPVRLADRLGGHLVQGHVDAVGRVRSIDLDETGGATMWVEVPRELRRYLVEKGSIAVDGVSLTVSGLEAAAFAVALIPHTLDVTTFGAMRPEDPVNLEVDVIAKYVEGLLEGTRP